MAMVRPSLCNSRTWWLLNVPEILVWSCWYRLVYFDFVQQPVDYYMDLDYDILKHYKFFKYKSKWNKPNPVRTRAINTQLTYSLLLIIFALIRTLIGIFEHLSYVKLFLEWKQHTHRYPRLRKWMPYNNKVY